jgi:Na+/H+ antiporter NhaC
MVGSAASGPWIYLGPVIAVAMIVLRNARRRRLKVERLWIAPLVFLAITGLMFASQPPPSPAFLVVDVAALALGALAGWWRGRLTRIAVDPQTHALTSKTSPLGMLLILAIFAARYGLRAFGAQTAGLLHVSVLEITDSLMLVAVGLVCAQRLEIALRATRLLNQARGQQPT